MKYQTHFPRVSKLLESMGQEGANTQELAAALGWETQKAERVLTAAAKAEIVEWRPDPQGRAWNRRRWYAQGLKADGPLTPKTAAPAPCANVVVEWRGGVKVTRAMPLRERYAPEPGWVPAITSDWMLRRQLGP